MVSTKRIYDDHDDDEQHDLHHFDSSHEATITADDDDDDACKIFVSRIPSHFTEDSVRRLVEDVLGPQSVIQIALPTDATPSSTTQDDEDNNNNNSNGVVQAKKTNDTMDLPDRPASSSARGKHVPLLSEPQQQHRGFGFVTLASNDLCQQALARGKVRGGAKSTSTKKHTLYLRPVRRNNQNNNKEGTTTEDEELSSSNNICFLWTNHSCPYGKDCKFLHQGPGGILPKGTVGSNATTTDDDDAAAAALNVKKQRKKCWNFRKGKCHLGSACPFSHDFVVPIHHYNNDNNNNNKQQDQDDVIVGKPQEEKDCINWKTRGECRRFHKQKCPYRHDEAVRQAALLKQSNNKRKRNEETVATDSNDTKQKPNNNTKKKKKQPQPLSVKVSGLGYNTTYNDIQSMFQDCGRITQILFPTFEDSGRSKGFCAILFTSPKAVEQAIADYNGFEILPGRNLQVTPILGKWYRDVSDMVSQHEQTHDQQQQQQSKSASDNVIHRDYNRSDLIGEFGQKVKRRKRHGYKE